MDYKDKTREELILELEGLKQENTSLKSSHEKDIFKMKQNEVMLQASEAKFRSYFDLPIIGIAITSPKKGWIEVNQGVISMLGYSRDELAGLTWAELTHPEDLAADVEQFNRLMADQQDTYILEKRFIPKNGDVLWTKLSIGCVRKPDRTVDYTVALLQDISERKKIEQELKESEKKYRDLFEKAQFGMFRTRMDGSKVLEVNEKLCEIVGFSKEEMTSNPSMIRYADPKRRDELIALLKQSTSVSDFEAEIITKDGSAKFLLMSMTAYPEDGILEGSFVDITDRKKVEAASKIINEQLRELNATKDKFFSIIAHDLINPFNSILGFSDTLLKEGRDLDIDDIMKYIDILHSSAHHTHRLLENLLDWARMQQGRIPFDEQPILLNSLVKSEVDHQKHNADQKNIKLTTAIKEEIILTADEKMLGTVLRNLISNAIKFTRKAGEVVIQASRKAGQVEITVSDTGIGMSSDTLEKLFRIETSFSTRGTGNEKGSGLGLLLCKEFVEKHGGSITVESKIGKGSSFKVSLPVSSTF